MKGERQEHCEEENVLVACIVVLKASFPGSLRARMKTRLQAMNVGQGLGKRLLFCHWQ